MPDPIAYDVQFKPRAVRDLDALPLEVQRRILGKISAIKTNLHGDVKRLTGFTPEYRLRVGDYRVLFELTGRTIIVYRVRRRSEAYR
jgi:mRNA interferase RelE/StbE